MKRLLIASLALLLVPLAAAPSQASEVKVSGWPGKIVPYRPFELAVTTPGDGTLTVYALHKNKKGLPRERQLWQQDVSAGAHEVSAYGKRLDYYRLGVRYSQGDETQEVTSPVQTKRKPYALVSRVNKADLGSSYQAGCPGKPYRLRAIDVNHVNYKGKVKRGRIIVNRESVDDVVRVFKKAFKKDFRIKSIIPVQAFQSSDDLSMRADNTSGFNCRRYPVSGNWSRHAHGKAVDINPKRNPHLYRGSILPSNGAWYANRNRKRHGMIRAGDVVHRAFVTRGWTWGGIWSNPDYQHFQQD